MTKRTKENKDYSKRSLQEIMKNATNFENVSNIIQEFRRKVENENIDPQKERRK